jgi:hypothetical protein
VEQIDDMVLALRKALLLAQADLQGTGTVLPD